MKLVSLPSLALTFTAIFAPIVAQATPITFSAGALASTMITPSSDTLTLDTTSTVFAGPGTFAFQTGNIYIGDSEIANQIIPFSFTDTITINGITKNVTISAQDNVTTGPDILTIFAGTPVNFGDVTFQLNSSTYVGAGSVGENIPVTLSASISQTPEPASFALLGTGIMGLFMIGRARGRVLA